MKKKIRAILLTFTLVSAMAAGCGASDEGKSDSGNTATEEEAGSTDEAEEQTPTEMEETEKQSEPYTAADVTDDMMDELYASIKDSVGGQGATRLKPRNFGDFQRYPQSAYVQYASIVCLEKRRNSCG